MSFTLIAQIFIGIAVLVTIIFFMIEKIDKIKIAFLFSLISMLIFLFFIFTKEAMYEEVNFLEFTYELINLEAILIIFSISIIVTLTKKAGFFGFLSLNLIKLTKGKPWKLFIVLGAITFFVSMFFDNLSAIILLGSLTVVICKQMDINPVPYVLFVGLNTIIGGLPTPVSSIPNIIFYSDYGKISFIEFMKFALPLSILFFIITTGYFFLIFKKDLLGKISKEKIEQIELINPWSGVVNKRDIWKSMGLLGILFTGFLLTSLEANPLDIAFVALIVAIIGIFLFRSELKELIKEGIEWEMIVFFICLFILMGILNKSGALDSLTVLLKGIIGDGTNPLKIAFVSIIIGTLGFLLTGVLNAIPASVIFSSIFHSLEISSTGLWFAFLLSTNMGSAVTPIGSATIIMALEVLRIEKIGIDFRKYLTKVVPIVLILQIISLAYSILLIYIV